MSYIFGFFLQRFVFGATKGSHSFIDLVSQQHSHKQIQDEVVRIKFPQKTRQLLSLGDKGEGIHKLNI